MGEDGDIEYSDQPAKEDYARLEELAGKGGLLFSFMDHPEDPEEVEEDLLLLGAFSVNQGVARVEREAR